MLGSSSPLADWDEATVKERTAAVGRKLRDWGVNMLFVVAGAGGVALAAGARGLCAARARAAPACARRARRARCSRLCLRSLYLPSPPQTSRAGW